MAWGRNPYNADHTLFQLLTRLFSGPIVNYRRQTEKALKNKQLGKYALKLRDTNGKQFKKTIYNPFENLQSSAMAQHQRSQRYTDFREMEFTPEISSALDIYADEITTSSKLSPMLSINCPNEEIKEVLRVLYHDVLNLDYNLFGWVRSVCKFGDFFLYLDIEENKGIIRTIGLPVEEVERIEGEDKTNPDYVQYRWGAGGLTLENWQIAHFRNLGEEKFWPYGSSVLDPARRIFRQLDLLEQAVIAYRIVRSPERRVFYIDVGNIPPTDVEQFMQRVMTQMKRHALADGGTTSTGRVDLRYNPLPVSHLTQIPLLDGRVLPISALAAEYDEGKQLWVYSINDKTHQMVPGKVVWCGKNYSATKMVKVTLDDGSHVLTAPEHPFVMRDGAAKRADALKMNDSLMPFYRKASPITTGSKNRNKLYEMVYDPSEKDYVFTHRAVAKEIYPQEMVSKGATVHHKHPENGERNKFNNAPENLQVMGFRQHAKFHREHCEMSLNRPEQLEQKRDRLKRWWSEPGNDESKQTIREHIIDFNRSEKHDVCVRKLVEYNNSDLHEQHNEIRSQAMTKLWADSTRRASAVEKMTCKFDEKCFSYIVELARSLDKKISMDAFCLKLKGNAAFMKHFRAINKDYGKKIEKALHRARLRFLMQERGYDDFYAFLERHNTNSLQFRGGSRKKNNHKVVSVEFVDYPEGHDVYCMTVVGPNGEEDRHNFAVCGFGQQGGEKTSQLCGIIVKNSIEDDYYIPVRGSTSGTKIESLPGAQYTGDIEDIKYLRDKLFSAIKIPMSYLSHGEGASEDKESLAQKDIRFARTIQRLQRAITAELTKIGIIHLYVLGYRSSDLLTFNLDLNNPSKIAELQELEQWRTKFDVASSATEGFFSRRWIAEKIFNLSEEEYLRNQREMFYDRALDAKLDSIGEGASGEGGVGDIGMPPDEEIDAAGTLQDLEAGAEGDSGTADGAESDSMLLAAPGKRNEPYLTPGAKGKLYHPVTSDKRNMGARKRHMQSKYSKEMASRTERNLFQGYSGLKSLANGIAEGNENQLSLPIEVDSDQSEDQISKINSEMRQILENLNKRQERSPKIIDAASEEEKKDGKDE